MGTQFMSPGAIGPCFPFVFRWCHYFRKTCFSLCTIPGGWVRVKLLLFLSYFRIDYLEMPF